MRKLKLLIVIVFMLILSGCTKKYTLGPITFSVPSSWKSEQDGTWGMDFFVDDNNVLQVQLYSDETSSSALEVIYAYYYGLGAEIIEIDGFKDSAILEFKNSVSKKYVITNKKMNDSGMGNVAMELVFDISIEYEQIEKIIKSIN